LILKLAKPACDRSHKTYRFEVSVARSNAATLASISSSSIALLEKLMMDSEHRARVEGGVAVSNINFSSVVAAAEEPC
jgi:hypothetical protein